MDFGELVRQSITVAAQNPQAAGAVIGGTMISLAIGLWRLADPARAMRKQNRRIATQVRRHTQGRTPAIRRSTPTMSLRSRKRAPEPGTYVSLTEPPMDAQGRNAYEQLGLETIRSATDRFYSRVQRDPRLAGYFPPERIEHLKRHLPLLVGQLLGGPVQYQSPGDVLLESHRKLNISPSAYAFLSAHLNTVLYELGAPQHIRVFLAAQLIMVENFIIAEHLQQA